MNFKPLIRELRCWDLLQFTVMVLLLAAGLIFIHSTGEQIDTVHSRSFLGKQLVWIGIGFAA